MRLNNYFWFVFIILNTTFTSAYGADNWFTRKGAGYVSLVDNTSRIWQANVCYTTDGSGNVIPISGGSGGGGGLTDTQLRASPVPVVLPASVKTPGLLVTSTSGTVAAGASEVSFLVSSSSSVMILGVVMVQGEYVNYKAPPGTTLGAITYDATGGVLKINEVR